MEVGRAEVSAIVRRKIHRTGAIVRGMDIDETDVKEGERIAQPVREMVLRSGDNTLVRIIRTLPDESFARLKDILSSPTI